MYDTTFMETYPEMENISKINEIHLKIELISRVLNILNVNYNIKLKQNERSRWHQIYASNFRQSQRKKKSYFSYGTFKYSKEYSCFSISRKTIESHLR